MLMSSSDPAPVFHGVTNSTVELVHPKIMSLITHPDVVPDPLRPVQLSMEGLRALRFKLKKLCSDDERRSYESGTSSEWVINYIIFIFGWTNRLTLAARLAN